MSWLEVTHYGCEYCKLTEITYLIHHVAEIKK